MTLDQLPSPIDYAMTAPTPAIIALASAIATIIFFALMLMAITKDVPRTVGAVALAVIASVIIWGFSMNAAEDDLARVRAEAVSQHLDETYGIDVGFTEDGVQPGGLDGSAVHDGSAVYRIAVATDGSILLVDEGGKEVPRVTR